MRTVCQVIGGMAVLLVGAAMVHAAASKEDPFYKGLQDRSLRSLMETYLKQRTGEIGATTTGQPTGAGQVSAKLALADLEQKKALAARTLGDRDTAFRSAQKLYEEAIEEGAKAAAAIHADHMSDRIKARLAVLKARLEVSKMIFEKWLKTDLEFLEITDRRGGDRGRAVELLRVATEHYRDTLDDAQSWRSLLDQLPPNERQKISNLYDRDVRAVEREAKYSNAWTTYYYGWMLPSDYKPKSKKDRARKQVLEDAITAFMEYTKMPDKVSAKWYAHMVIGMSYREQGDYAKALSYLALANNASAPEPLKIQIAFERARTLLRKGDTKPARDLVDETLSFWKGKKDATAKPLLENNLYGLSLLLIKAESLIVEGKAGNNPEMKEKGVGILREIHTTRTNPWPMLVKWIMDSLLGAPTASPTDEKDPFLVWVTANDLLAKGQQDKNADDLKKAAELYKFYIEKKGPKDANYGAALYSQAACLLQLNRRGEAANLFRKVADEVPAYTYAKEAARYAISLRGQIYQATPTEENRAAYEDFLRWFVSKYGDQDLDQQYFYAMILYRGKKYSEAAEAFSRVSEKADHYAESRFWVPLSRLEHFRDKILPSGDKQLTLTGARAVVRDLLAYADYAFSMKGKGLPKEKEDQLILWAQTAYLDSAEVYLYSEVDLPTDALPLLDAVQQKFAPLSQDTRGRVLKMRIETYQKLNDLDKARKVLEEFLAVAKPKDAGEVLRGLFKATADDVRALIVRGQKELAAKNVDQAKAIGDRYLEWLEKSNVPDKAALIENVRYDLAELYLAVGNNDGALTIYQEIGGPKPHDPPKGQPMKEDCAYGMARSLEGLGDTTPDAARKKQYYESSLEMWRILISVAEQAKDVQALWDRRYHFFYCKFRLGQKEEVAEGLKTRQLLNRDEPLGGKDPLLQRRFLELLGAVSGN